MDAFICDVYGDAHAAYKQTANQEALAQRYLEWFADKRRELRESMREDIQVVEKDVLIDRRQGRPVTHGGVANLLKVLTRTMEKQGADIRSIAKVQYTICRQAGILIPDEFIEDVAVILLQE
jgi:hypothetical protein